MTDYAPSNFLAGHGLRRVVNACGPLTVLGGASVGPEVRQVVTEVLGASVEMAELQRRACAVIARVTGAEAGCVTACSAAGITIGVAACLTGDNIARIKRLPDLTGLRDEVIIQKGHVITAGGAPIDLLIRITGARLIEIGEAADCGSFQLEEAMGPKTGAAVFVAAARARRPGLLPFRQFVALAHAKGVPVVVDAAGQMDLRSYIAQGADLVVYSGHKFLGAPTSGMLCGRKELIRACYLQEFGIGRPMKVGKEGVAGLIAALELHERRNAEEVDRAHRQLLETMAARLRQLPGLACTIIPEGTETSAYRLVVTVDRATAGLTAYHLSRALEAGDPMVKVHDFGAQEGKVAIDPAMLTPEEADLVCARIAAILAEGFRAAGQAMAAEEKTLFDLRAERLAGWPDR